MLVEHVLQVADFITAEMEKIQEGSPADGDPAAIIAELDSFLENIKNGAVEEGKELPEENVSEEPKHFYIAPVANSASRFYKIYINFFPETEMANVHAYKTVYSLKEIAEDLLYEPEDRCDHGGWIPDSASGPVLRGRAAGDHQGWI